MFDIRDFTSVQAAIDAAEAVGGGAVYVPPGTHEHGDLVIGVAPVRIVGEGWASKLQHVGSGDALTVGSLNADATADSGAGDLHMLGGAASSRGVVMNRMHSAALRGVRVSGFAGDGIVLSGCYASQVRDCYSNNNGGDGLAIKALTAAGTDFSEIVGNKLLANGGRGLYVDNAARASAGGRIARNDVEGNAVGLKLCAGSAGNSDAWAIEGNYFESQIGANAEIGVGGGTGYFRALRLIGNIVNGGGAIALDRVQQVVIESNRIAGADLTITGNTNISHWSGNLNSGGASPGGFVNGDLCVPRLVVRQGAGSYATIAMSGGKVTVNWPVNVMGVVFPP